MRPHMCTHVVMKACLSSITLMQSMLRMAFVILAHLYIFVILFIKCLEFESGSFLEGWWYLLVEVCSLMLKG